MQLPLEDAEGREETPAGVWQSEEFVLHVPSPRFSISVVRRTAPGIWSSKPGAGRREGTSELVCWLVISVHMVAAAVETVQSPGQSVWQNKEKKGPRGSPEKRKHTGVEVSSSCQQMLRSDCRGTTTRRALCPQGQGQKVTPERRD